jgi:hypothetical protein
MRSVVNVPFELTLMLLLKKNQNTTELTLFAHVAPPSVVAAMTI